MTFQEIIDKYYPPGSLRRVIYMRHCESVARLALEIADRCGTDVEREMIYEAAMLHDIGICLTDARDIGCEGSEPYIMHGVLGGKLLRDHGMPEEYARVAERHTGAGITREDIVSQGLPLPPGDYMPRTVLERLVCYADKFYSKGGDMKRKSPDRVEASMARISQATLQRYLALRDEFGPVTE
ncbi:MAG: HDIG domain-containing protein [Bacteroides sp.]|nr:HDIG domain-containing protein [Bacteroides sp.]